MNASPLCYESIFPICDQSKGARVSSLVGVRSQGKYTNQFLALGLRRLRPLLENHCFVCLARVPWDCAESLMDSVTSAASPPSLRFVAYTLRPVTPIGGIVALPRQ